jgi:thiol-disulfide isomerase/thioredoxin
MKQKIRENYRKIGLGLLAVLLVTGLAFTVVQNPQNKTGPEKTVENSEADNSEEFLPETGNRTTVYFFWGEGCPYCEREKPFLEELDREHEDLEVKMYEVYNSRENQKIYQNLAEKYGVTARGIPGTFIGDEHWSGYNAEIGNEIESKIDECLKQSCKTPLE